MIKTPNNNTFTRMFLKKFGFPAVGSMMITKHLRKKIKEKKNLKGSEWFFFPVFSESRSERRCGWRQLGLFFER
jgi:hypothetical protein